MPPDLLPKAEKRPVVSAETFNMAAQIAQHVEMKSVYLHSAKIERTEGLDGRWRNPEGWVVNGTQNVSHSYDEKTGLLRVTVERLAEIQAPISTESRKKPELRKIARLDFAVSVEYGFRVTGGPTGAELGKHLSAFAQINGVFNAWPYMRETAQALTARMGFPPLTLGIHRMPALATSDGKSSPRPERKKQDSKK